jgi:hypothetical protein
MLASDAVDELTPSTIQIASAQDKKLCAQIPFTLLQTFFLRNTCKRVSLLKGRSIAAIRDLLFPARPQIRPQRFRTEVRNI